MKATAFTLGLVLTLAFPALPSRADEHAPRVPLLPAYRQECTGCHIAYPPSMLPAASWQRLLNDLPHHYGNDASIDPPTVKTLAAWLGANAASGRGAAVPPDDRITRSAWFRRQHDEVPAEAWKRPAVRSASNCAACHAGAEAGDFDEHRVRIPR
jgi:hypothetical protein